MNTPTQTQGGAPSETAHPGNSWYLVKRGLYYRPNAAGYTSEILEAGIFSEAVALSHVRSTAGEKSADMRVKMVRVPRGSGATETDLRVKYDALLAEAATLHAQLGEARAECERLKAREITLTDRQCLVQLAFTELGFNYESGEGLPELAKRVAGMASAYRARDNIGMSREEYHKAKNALTQIARLQQREGEALTGEEYFADRDLFMRYVANHVQPARLKEGLAVLSERSCEVSYDIITSKRYRAVLQSVAKEGEQ